MKSRSLPLYLLGLVAAVSWSSDSVLAYVPPSSFHGRSLALEAPRSGAVRQHVPSSLTMRKQKASDKRTTRLQRGEGLPAIYDDTAVMQSLHKTFTSSPMADAVWEQKVVRNQFQGKQPEKSGGRGRSRKRSSLYHCLSNYHEQFLTLLTAEYKAEVRLLRFSETPIKAKIPVLFQQIHSRGFLARHPPTHPFTRSLTYFHFRKMRCWVESRRP